MAVALLLQLAFFGQRSARTNVSEGETLHQSIKLYDSTNSEVNVELPAGENMLFYRYRGYNWFTDSPDSLARAQQIIRNIVGQSPSLKKLRVICYAYNLDNFLNNKARPSLPPDSDFTFEFYCLNNRSSSSLVNSGKLTLLDRTGKVLATSDYLGNFAFAGRKNPMKVFRAKLLTEKNGDKVPVTNAKVYLLGANMHTGSLTAAVTNKFGDFEIESPEEEATLKVEADGVTNVILATQEGRELSKLQRTADGFTYKFIAAEMQRMIEMPVDEDLSLAVADFARTRKHELMATEDINYDVARYELVEESKRKLDRLGRILMENQNIRVEVVSHTDSQGDDARNMELSEKRSGAVVAYLIFIGVNKSRLKAVGKGETEIRNRCKNGVDCSEEEHRYNRRTEFRFSRD